MVLLGERKVGGHRACNKFSSEHWETRPIVEYWNNSWKIGSWSKNYMYQLLK